MHEERIERHCRGVEETIESVQKQYEQMQNRLIDLAAQYKENMAVFETAFITATKSMRLKKNSLKEKLLKFLIYFIFIIYQTCCAK